ncbi:MAG: glycosyltransferase family 4 protein [Pseudomonadota bacterium]
MSQTNPNVIVVQAGPRHGYGLPIAFENADLLEAFYTDLCAGKGLGRLSGFPMPGRLGNAFQRWQNRQLPETVKRKTRTLDIATIPFEIEQYFKKSVVERRAATKELHAKQAERMIKFGFGQATHLVHQFGHGGDFIKRGKERGLTVLTDMIIAPSTGRIEQEEADAYPDWGDRPAPIPGLVDDADLELFRATSHYICPSRFVAKDLIENFDVEEASIRIVPYGINEQWLSVSNEPIPGRVLFVGSAERRKGIHFLAKASNILADRRPDVTMVVAGGVEDGVKHHPEAQTLNFLGRVPRSEIAQEFQRADIFILPSLAEGSATVIYEAMAVGLPIITTESSGSYVEHEHTGLIVPERDPDAIVEAVERLMEDRELRDHLAANAKAKATEFTWENFGKKWVNLILD